MVATAQMVELREFSYRGDWPYRLLADLRVRGGGRPAMIATRKALCAALRPHFEGEFRSGQGSSSVSLRLRSGNGFDLNDPQITLGIIDDAAKSLGLGLSAAPGVDAIAAARLGPAGHDRSRHQAGTWDAHLTELRGLWAPTLETWLLARAAAIGVADPRAVIALHFELPPLETILACAVVRQAGNYENSIHLFYDLIDGYDRGAINTAASALEAAGFISSLHPATSGNLFVAKRGRRLARVPRDWLLRL